MSVIVFRCAHHPSELNDRFIELFDRCDVLFVENIATDITMQLLVKIHLNQLSQYGFSDLYELFDVSDSYLDTFPNVLREFRGRIKEIIRGSKKRIEVEMYTVDRDKREESIQLRQEMIQKAFSYGDLGEACEMRIQLGELMEAMTEERDKHMAKQLVETLKEGSSEEVLALVGANHLTLCRLLRESGIEVEQRFPYTPYTFSLFGEVNRRIKFGLPYDIELVARSIAEIPIGEYLVNLGLPFRKCVELSRATVRKLSYADVEDMCRFASRHPEFYVEACVVWLKREKGIDLTNPTSFYKRQEL